MKITLKDIDGEVLEIGTFIDRELSSDRLEARLQDPDLSEHQRELVKELRDSHARANRVWQKAQRFLFRGIDPIYDQSRWLEVLGSNIPTVRFETRHQKIDLLAMSPRDLEMPIGKPELIHRVISEDHACWESMKARMERDCWRPATLSHLAGLVALHEIDMLRACAAMQENSRHPGITVLGSFTNTVLFAQMWFGFAGIRHFDVREAMPIIEIEADTQMLWVKASA